MPRKPGLNSEFVMFDVVYEDGTQRSNRKVPRALLGGIDGDKPAHGFLIEQDREIAEKSGRPLASFGAGPVPLKNTISCGLPLRCRNMPRRSNVPDGAIYSLRRKPAAM